MTRLITNGLALNGQRITGLGDASANTDAVTYQQLLNYVNGLAFKDDVRVATTTNGTLATAYANGQTVDGITLATGDRILIKNQTTQTENGIYVVAASGAPTRATDADSATDLNQATVRVRLGTTNAGTQWTQGTDAVVVGTSNIVFASSGGQSYTAASAGGLTLSSGAFSVNADGTSIIADATSVRVNPAYTGLAKRYSANIGDGSTTTITVTHNLGTKDVEVTVFDNSSFDEVLTDVNHATTNTVTLGFATAPASNAYRVVVIG